MNIQDKELVAELEKRIECVFGDPGLAVVALTHSSWVNEHPETSPENNERLEFLGDAVLGLAVSQRLMEKYPDSKEGILSKLRASLVNADILAEVGREIGLGELLRLGKGESMSGGMNKTSLLCNCFEAITGALYLSSGLHAVHDLVDRFLLPRTDGFFLERSYCSDYKSLVQEHFQRISGKTPKYRLVKEKGPSHARIFEVEIIVDDKALGRAEGRSKKEAEQFAARVALNSIEEKDKPES